MKEFLELVKTLGLGVAMLLVAVLVLWRKMEAAGRAQEERIRYLETEIREEREGREAERTSLLAKLDAAESRSRAELLEHLEETQKFVASLSLEQTRVSDLTRQLDSARSEVERLQRQLGTQPRT